MPTVKSTGVAEPFDAASALGTLAGPSLKILPIVVVMRNRDLRQI